jgi:catalase
MANLGKNGPRDVSGLTMTHCVPNERMKVDR